MEKLFIHSTCIFTSIPFIPISVLNFFSLVQHCIMNKRVIVKISLAKWLCTLFKRNLHLCFVSLGSKPVL